MPLNTNDTSIKRISVNSLSSPMGKVIVNGEVKWELLEATFGGLSGASPSSYYKQIVVSGEDIVKDPISP